MGAVVCSLGIFLAGCDSGEVHEERTQAQSEVAEQQDQAPAEHVARRDTAILLYRSADSLRLNMQYNRLLMGVEWGSEADSIDYSDPALGGAVPLVKVKGREDYRLTDNLHLGDFAASDGASYVRVSSELVDALDKIMDVSDQRIGITSGYRHPVLNSRRNIRGSARSMHMAGLAADIWSPGLTPLELAELALDVVGCKVGLGLGGTFIHLDVRGKLASWVTDDAAYTEEEFDRFVWFKCTGRDHGDAASAAERMAILRTSMPKPERPEPIKRRISAAQYSAEMAAFSKVRSRYGAGAVLLDAREASIRAQHAATNYVLGYIPLGSAQARALGVETLVTRAPQGYFVYVLIRDDSAPEIGMMSQESRLSKSRNVVTR